MSMLGGYDDCAGDGDGDGDGGLMHGDSFPHYLHVGGGHVP
eukprot:CAMPEP_0167824100 /NCGR_PEP_ID=MMETSP0112_2-20121227/8556_1 /TAXON_ID=91324 /ORGANISM="Lotharella globosa, Strain CCCM811" /LENGTH=40 /DNA_ID= /DNA_START= /DNA_END= /DNA_ORIENTATION=